jgi:hypothetical protein
MTISLKAILTLLGVLIHASLFCQQVVPGQIIVSKSDTIFCKIVKLEKSKADASLNYKEVSVLDSANGILTYFPGEIEGYIKEGIVYKSLAIDDNKIFIRQVVGGTASLYFHSGSKSSEYIFKRKNEEYYNVLNVPDQTIRKMHGNYGNVTGSQGRLSDIYIIEKDKAFMNYFVEYFKDCLVLVNKIKSEFYTSSDMKDIFSDYNKYCGKI